MLFQRQNLLENIFPAQWKTEFQSYFSQKLLESARKKKIYKVFFFFFCLFLFLFFFFFIVFNGYDIKIQKENFPAVGINKTLSFLFVLFCLFYI